MSKRIRVCLIGLVVCLALAALVGILALPGTARAAKGGGKKPVSSPRTVVEVKQGDFVPMPNDMGQISPTLISLPFHNGIGDLNSAHLDEFKDTGEIPGIRVRFPGGIDFDVIPLANPMQSLHIGQDAFIISSELDVGVHGFSFRADVFGSNTKSSDRYQNRYEDAPFITTCVMEGDVGVEPFCNSSGDFCGIRVHIHADNVPVEKLQGKNAGQLIGTVSIGDLCFWYDADEDGIADCDEIENGGDGDGTVDIPGEASPCVNCFPLP